MLISNELSIFDFVYAISEIVDLVSQDLNNHHKRVTYISYKIAQEMKLTEEEINDIVLSAILHDIGAFSAQERIKIKMLEIYDSDANHHAEIGSKLIKRFKHFDNVAEIVRYHHTNFDSSRPEIPLGSYIIHLADILSFILDENREILGQVKEIHEKIDNKRSWFHPDTLSALKSLSKLECFWYEACSPTIDIIFPKRVLESKGTINSIALRDFAKIIACLIDFRSKFTATHSSGVAVVASEIAKISGFTARECGLAEISGYLHDIGKLAISNEILEKKGALNNKEHNAIRKHTYYTYSVLNKITGLEQVAILASHHHERPDGKGYPFHVKGDDFSKLARIVAVADVATAITEDRPYRLGMSSEEALKALCDMAENGKIDKDIVKIVEENFSQINDARIKAQKDASEEYDIFAIGKQ